MATQYLPWLEKYSFSQCALLILQIFLLQLKFKIISRFFSCFSLSMNIFVNSENSLMMQRLTPQTSIKQNLFIESECGSHMLVMTESQNMWTCHTQHSARWLHSCLPRKNPPQQSLQPAQIFVLPHLSFYNAALSSL